MSLSGGGRARALQRSAAPDRRPRATQLAADPYFYPPRLRSFGSATSSADLKETGFALIAPAWSGSRPTKGGFPRQARWPISSMGHRRSGGLLLEPPRRLARQRDRS